MTDQEWLAEIKERMHMHGDNHGLENQWYEDINWLIEQAEGKQKMLEQTEHNFKAMRKQEQRIGELEKALEYYANHPVPLEGGKVAREALEGK